MHVTVALLLFLAPAILEDLGMKNDPNVILIDARSDNKPSGSRATGSDE